MKGFDRRYFQPFTFSEENLERYLKSAQRDLKIAKEDGFAEVIFTYAYQTLVKAGIALLGKVGAVKVRSVPGHHVKILEKMSEVLDDEDIFVLGNAMRMKRNLDFYSGGEMISEKEAAEYLSFVEGVMLKVEEKMKERD